MKRKKSWRQKLADSKLVGWATCCPCDIFMVEDFEKSLVKQAN